MLATLENVSDLVAVVHRKVASSHPSGTKRRAVLRKLREGVASHEDALNQQWVAILNPLLDEEKPLPPDAEMREELYGHQTLSSSVTGEVGQKGTGARIRRRILLQRDYEGVEVGHTDRC